MYHRDAILDPIELPAQKPDSILVLNGTVKLEFSRRSNAVHQYTRNQDAGSWEHRVVSERTAHALRKLFGRPIYQPEGD